MLLWVFKLDNYDVFEFDEEENLEARDIHQDNKDINIDNEDDDDVMSLHQRSPKAQVKTKED